MKAREIMTKDVIAVKPEATIGEIARLLIEHRISGLPVVDSDGVLTGIVTEGDLLRKETNPRLPSAVNILGAIVYYHGVDRYEEDWRKLLALTATDMMTEKVITVTEDDEIEHVAQLMVKHGVKRVPVMDGTRLAGIISRADIIKKLLT